MSGAAQINTKREFNGAPRINTKREFNGAAQIIQNANERCSTNHTKCE
jgi:hypothetical protein